VSEKVPMVQKVKEVLLHYYHGFRLLALDSRVAFRLLRKTMKGSSLTRRELKQVDGGRGPGTSIVVQTNRHHQAQHSWETLYRSISLCLHFLSLMPVFLLYSFLLSLPYSLNQVSFNYC